MYLLYCDETNLAERAGDFLIYGGVAVNTGLVLALSQRIDEIRTANGVDPSFNLKFNPGPDQLDHRQFIGLKQAVIEVAVEHRVKLIVYLVLHDIARNPDEARRFGINTVCYHFDCLLNQWGEPGLVLVDRFNDEGNVIDGHLREKFSVGLKAMPFSDQIRLGNIVGLHYSAIGQSHMTSVIDIILGSFRFAINAHTRDERQNEATARRLLGMLAPMCHREGADRKISELSLSFSPKMIQRDHFRARYDALKQFLDASGMDTEQEITADPTH